MRIEKSKTEKFCSRETCVTLILQWFLNFYNHEFFLSSNITFFGRYFGECPFILICVCLFLIKFPLFLWGHNNSKKVECQDRWVLVPSSIIHNS